jgi:hypothetical protein
MTLPRQAVTQLARLPYGALGALSNPDSGSFLFTSGPSGSVILPPMQLPTRRVPHDALVWLCDTACRLYMLSDRLRFRPRVNSSKAGAFCAVRVRLPTLKRARLPCETDAPACSPLPPISAGDHFGRALTDVGGPCARTMDAGFLVVGNRSSSKGVAVRQIVPVGCPRIGPTAFQRSCACP